MASRLAKIATHPVCILGAGKCVPNSFITTKDCKELIKTSRQYALNNHINNVEDEQRLYSVTDWLLETTDNLLIDKRCVALDSDKYESLHDYWLESKYQLDMSRWNQNRASKTIQNSIISSCNNAILSTTTESNFNKIKSQITHVLVHTDAPMQMPPISSSLISQLELSNNTHPISIANHGCGGPHVALEIAQSICDRDENALVLCHFYNTATTYLSWFNEFSNISNSVNSKSINNIRSHFISSAILGDMFFSVLIGRPKVENNYSYPLFTINNTHHIQIPNTGAAANDSQMIGNLYIGAELKNLLIWGIQSGVNWDEILYQCIGDGDGYDENSWNDCDYSFHAGGKSILKGFETALKYKGVKNIENRMKIVYEITRNYGNTGCCSSLLTLDQTLRNTERDNICHIGCAPGISLYFHGFTRLEKYLSNNA
eukprot:127006_1